MPAKLSEDDIQGLSNHSKLLGYLLESRGTTDETRRPVLASFVGAHGKSVVRGFDTHLEAETYLREQDVDSNRAVILSRPESDVVRFF